MKELKVKPIPTRNWKDKNVDLVVERDKDRKGSQESVDKRIYYMWFNYLKLCLNLEEINSVSYTHLTLPTPPYV